MTEVYDAGKFIRDRIPSCIARRLELPFFLYQLGCHLIIRLVAGA